MAAPSRTPRPPAIEGAPHPRRRDVLRAVWWGRRAWSLSARSGPIRDRFYPGALALVWWPLLPLIVTVQFYEVSKGTTRFYMSVERDAILGVHANRHGWHVIDHAAARPGCGRGHALRQTVFSPLTAEADRYGITILATAVNQQLASHYIKDVPGLVDVGPAPHGRRRLVRKPGPPVSQSSRTLASTA